MWWIVILIILAVLFIAFCALSVGMAHYAAYGKRSTLKESWDWQMNLCDDIHYLSMENDFEHYTIPSYDGYIIHCSLLTVAKAAQKDIKTDRYVILCHGYTDARYGMLKYLPVFSGLDFNVVLYDERGHGENKKAPCSFGIREAKDLAEVIKDTRNRYGKDIKLGIMGESLGGGTVMTALKYKPEVDFCIEDCGFADIVNVLEKGVKDTFKGIPSGIVGPASIAAKICYGESFKAARPIDSLYDNEIPFLVMHGGGDDFITPDNGKRVYDADKGYKEICIIDGAEHASSVIKDRKKYIEVAQKFIKKVLQEA